MNRFVSCAPLAISALLAAGAADAKPLVFGGKLPLTRGATSVEGAAGAGLATWALIAGQATEDGVGASIFATVIPLSDYDFTAYGAAIGFFDRVEVSYARQNFDTGETGAALGLGEGFTFAQDIVGAKIRVFGDAVYAQDSWLPQVAVGAQFKRTEHEGLVAALGATNDSGVDLYVAATKIVLDQSLVLNGTIRFTEANQFGLLGFGGDRDEGRSTQIELSGAYLATDRLLIGAEYRSRPDNLAFAREDDAYDVFAAYALTDAVTVVAGYAALGDIATFADQRGAYLSLQVGF
ncbi:MAG: DUF3034 family protein [Hyphomonadaceae bacterium]|nr:DUF3034 family protein [Hyphomonadaceae bacterium]